MDKKFNSGKIKVSNKSNKYEMNYKIIRDTTNPELIKYNIPTNLHQKLYKIGQKKEIHENEVLVELLEEILENKNL